MYKYYLRRYIYYGIDFGNSKIDVSYCKNGENKLLINNYINYVYIDKDNNLVFGDKAYNGIIKYPFNTISNIPYLRYIKDTNINVDLFKIDYGNISNKYMNYDISELFKKSVSNIKDIMTVNYGHNNINNMCISIPKFYNDDNKEYLYNIFKENDIIIERYIENYKSIIYGNNIDPNINKKYIILIIGEMYSEVYKISTLNSNIIIDDYNYSIEINNNSIDKAIVNFVLQDYYDINNIDLRSDIIFRNKLLSLLKANKNQLNSKFEIDLNIKLVDIETIVSDLDFKYSLNRDKYLKVVHDSINKLLHNIDLYNIEDIIVEGGLFKLKIIREYLISNFRANIIYKYNCIALGASLYYYKNADVNKSIIYNTRLGFDISIKRSTGLKFDIFSKKDIYPCNHELKIKGSYEIVIGNNILGTNNITIFKQKLNKDNYYLLYFSINQDLILHIKVITEENNQLYFKDSIPLSPIISKYKIAENINLNKNKNYNDDNLKAKLGLELIEDIKNKLRTIEQDLKQKAISSNEILNLIQEIHTEINLKNITNITIKYNKLINLLNNYK